MCQFITNGDATTTLNTTDNCYLSHAFLADSFTIAIPFVSDDLGLVISTVNCVYDRPLHCIPCSILSNNYLS